jgi:hypothetical protein
LLVFLNSMKKRSQRRVSPKFTALD